MKEKGANIVILSSLIFLVVLIIIIGIRYKPNKQYGNSSFIGSDSSIQLPVEIPPSGRVAELITELNSKERGVAYDAVKELQSMGSEAKAAIPALVDIATYYYGGDFVPYYEAGRAIPIISKEASLPYLIEALKEPTRRYWAANILEGYGEIAKPAIPELVKALREIKNAQTSDDESACYQAAATLSKICPEGLNVLIGEMAHHDTLVRKMAVKATPRGINGLPAANELDRRLLDNDHEVRWLAAVALGDIGVHAKNQLFSLKYASQRETNPFTRTAMLNAIDKIQNEN